MKDNEGLKKELDSLKEKAKERTVKTQSFDVDLESLVKGTYTVEIKTQNGIQTKRIIKN